MGELVEIIVNSSDGTNISVYNKSMKTQKIKIAEIFHSLQGEGLWVGQPSVFVRTFGCNFQCRGFGMPAGCKTDEPEEIVDTFLKENPGASYEELPLAKTGCDSYASWHPKFKSLSPMLTVDSIVDEMEKVRYESTRFTKNNGSCHLVITGGEPLLGWQRAYPELLQKTKAAGYTHVTFETNGTQPIKDELKDYMITEGIKSDIQHRFTFSVSPKLSCSGESIDDALQPEVVANYCRYGTTYLKFVVANHDDLSDAVTFVNAYRDAGFHGGVFLMPMGGTPDSYNLTAPDVAKLCMIYGFRYSPRLQVDLWKNEWGT